MATRRRTKTPRRARARPKKRGEENSLEAYHRQSYIQPRLDSGEYEEYIGYEALSFALFEDTTGKRVMYTPDHSVKLANGEIELQETKGGMWRGDSRIRFKAAAARYPQFHWRSFLYSLVTPLHSPPRSDHDT